MCLNATGSANCHPTSLPPKPSRREKKSVWRTEASTEPFRVWLPAGCSAKSKRDFIQKCRNGSLALGTNDTWHISEIKDAPLCRKCHAPDVPQSRTKDAILPFQTPTIQNGQQAFVSKMRTQSLFHTLHRYGKQHYVSKSCRTLRPSTVVRLPLHAVNVF